MHVATLLHAALQGLPAKDTTLRMQECPFFEQVCPMFEAKHLDLRRGFIRGGLMLLTFGITDRAHWGKALTFTAQINDL